MLIVMEGIVMCFILLVICVVGIANGPVGLVVLYEDDVQQRVVELGLTTRARLKKSLIVTSLAMFGPVLVLTPLMVYGLNGAESFWSGFWQMTAVLWIMGIFDRVFIDWYWVGKTKAWEIPGTEDLMPYIPRKTLMVKWVFTLLGFPLIAAAIAALMLLF